MRWRWLLLSLSACAVQSASGAWLGVCSKERAELPGSLLAEYVSPQGARTALIVDAAPLPNCVAVELPFAPETVVAGRLVSPDVAVALAPGFALTGRATEQPIRLSEVVPRDERHDVTTIPAGVELSNELAASAFGVEERAVGLHENGRITLDCTAGKSPAGMVLRMPYRGLPRAIALVASVAYAANGEFEWGLSDARRAASGDPLPLATLRAATATSLIDLPPAGLDIASVESVTIACPREAARLELRSLKIEPKTARARAPSRALWAWQPDAWMQTSEALLEKLVKAGADTLFMTVPVDVQAERVVQPRALEAFVEAARRRGVRVWAVVGDPGAVIESERAGFARLPAAYARYNRGVRAEARLAGVQYDIEPYLNAGYAIEPAAWHEAYLATLRQLKRAAELPVDVVVPYWWADQQTSGGRLIEQLATVVDSVTVMGYRTESAQIKRIAQPFLEWGERHTRAVRIALESGPIPDEVQHHYRPARSGEAALIAIGPYHVMLAFDRVLSFPAFLPAAQIFSHSHVTPVPGSATTFAGRRDALLTLLPGLERLWGAWPAFAGTALHEFEP
jgi:hypothetical protein